METKNHDDDGRTAVLPQELPFAEPVAVDSEPILVIDDEKDVAEAVAEFLGTRGFEVEVALNSRQALGLIHDSNFSVVISDLRLPDLSGVELLDHVLEADPDTVFIMMTGYASVQSAVSALKKGAYDYIVKPFSMFELEKTVRLGLERRKLAKQNVELSHLMRKLIELDQIKSNIISAVSHEFRTPLTSLKGYLTMFAEHLSKASPSKHPEATWLRAMRENLNRLETLILNLLFMTETNSGGVCLSDEDVELGGLVSEAISRVEPVTRVKNVRIDFKHDKGEHLVGDSEKLLVALVNLLENAVKFNLDDGRVEVSISNEDDHRGVVIEIEDTGIGIPPDKLSSVFDCFMQADMTHTRQFSGAGLGLPVAKAIIEAHGGKIDVSSRPGIGTRFRIWLPKRSGVQYGEPGK